MSRYHSSGELVDPVALAERILDKCDAGQEDPDSDIAVLARQFLRAMERINAPPLAGRDPDDDVDTPADIGDDGIPNGHALGRLESE